MRLLFWILLITIVPGVPYSAFAQAGTARRSFLFKDNRGDLASARARGESEVTVIVAAMPGANARLVRAIEKMGGTIRFRADNVDYLRARVPVDSVDRLVRDPLVHSLDINMKGSDRGFAADPSAPQPLTPDDARPLDSRTGGPPLAAVDTGARVWPPVQSDYPLANRYEPLEDMGGMEFRREHPQWDGRGVTLALIDMNPDPFEPELQVARTLDGAPVSKIAFYQTAVDQLEEEDGTWLEMKDSVTASQGAFTYDGRTYRAPRDGTFGIALLDEEKFDSLSSAGLKKDLNRDGNPPGTSRLFAVLWDRKANDVWVDTNQDRSFADEKALTNYAERPDFAAFGRDDPATPVRESVGFAVQIDTAARKVGILAGVPYHASLVVGAALGSRGTQGRFEGVAPGARLASVAEGCQAYGQTEAVILALENPEIDGAWLEQCSNITRPYLLRDGRLVPTVIYSRLIAKYRKPLMIPTHNYPVLGAADDFVLAECGIGVGGHESKANFLTNYGFRTEHDDNLLITGGYGPMGTGAFGPTIISPSNIMSGNRGWELPAAAHMGSVFQMPPGYLIAGGTSTATPTASGAVALLISAAKQTGVKYDACALKHAIASSARYVPHIPAYKQGNGVIDIAGAWEVLKAMGHSGSRVTITSSAPVKHVYGKLLPTPNEGVGLYEREGWHAGDSGRRTVTFTRTTGPKSPMKFTIAFTGDSGTFSAPGTVELPLGEPVPVAIDISPKTPGVHSALLTLDNPDVPGHAYRMLTTVVAAEPLNAANEYTVTTSAPVPRPGMRSLFYEVPEGTMALKVVLEAPKREVQLAIVGPDTRTADVAHVVVERRRGAGGSRADAPRPKETFVAGNPMPGVWEIRLTDIADVREFDWRASLDGGPVPPTEATITISALAVEAKPASLVASLDGAPGPSGSAGRVESAPAAGDGATLSFSSRMAKFEGVVSSYPLGSAHRERLTIADRAQVVHELDVPAGTESLMARVSSPSDTSADLDVYVYDCTGEECRISSVGGDPAGDERVVVRRPKAGKWRIVVDAASVPGGSTSYDYLDVVFNQAYGRVAATDIPSERGDDADPWTVRTNVWAASLPEGRESFAAVPVVGVLGTTQQYPIGMFEVPR